MIYYPKAFNDLKVHISNKVTNRANITFNSIEINIIKQSYGYK